MVAVLKTMAQVEGAQLVGTAPRQGATMVEVAALEGSAGQAVIVKAAAVEAATLLELVVMVGVASGQDAGREEMAASV